MTPKTVEGKIVTMCYALIGVPLMLMCLSNLGRVLAESVRQTYARLCIRQSEHHKCPTEDTDDPDTYHGHTYQSAEEKNEVCKWIALLFHSENWIIWNCWILSNFGLFNTEFQGSSSSRM